MPSSFGYESAQATVSLADVMTVPAGAQRILVGAQAANVHVGATPLDAAVDVAIYRAVEADTFYLVRTLTIPVGAAIDVITGKVVLEAGDKIQIRADLAEAIDFNLSYLELT